jgi:hypothetical protein
MPPAWWQARHGPAQHVLWVLCMGHANLALNLRYFTSCREEIHNYEADAEPGACQVSRRP